MKKEASGKRGMRRRERQFIRTFLCIGLIGLGSGYALLQTAWDAEGTGRWLAGGILMLPAVAWRIAGAFETDSRSLPVAFFPGMANRITALRGLILCGLFGFLFSDPPRGTFAWAPAVLFIATLLLDGLDGYVARRRGETSAFGAFLDRDFDGLGTLAGVLLIVRYGRVPSWYIVMGLAYYLFILAQWTRRRRGLLLLALPPSTYRRCAAGLQSAFIAFALLPVPQAAAILPIFAVAVAVPVLAGFLRDWRSVSRCDHGTPPIRKP